MMPLLLHLLTALALTPDAPSSASCRQELNRIHTVTTPEGRFLLYGDPLLASYLQSLGRAPIIPIYEDEPVAFPHNGAIVVSTGLILQAASESDFTRGLPSSGPRQDRRNRLLLPIQTACSSAPAALSFHDLQARLAAEISRYKYLTTPHLISRSAPASPPSTGSFTSGVR